MPNWCENRVSIYCDRPEILKEFTKECMTNGVFDFFKIVPLGLGEDENGNPKWEYNTAIGKWGTKWQLCDDDADGFLIKEDRIEANFDTAWGPPVGIYDAIEAWFQDRVNPSDFSISWFYDEPGMQFAGYLNNE